VCTLYLSPDLDLAQGQGRGTSLQRVWSVHSPPRDGSTEIAVEEKDPAPVQAHCEGIGMLIITYFINAPRKRNVMFQ
jgi:hypothetical protein